MNEIHTAAQPLVMRLAKGGWQVHTEQECVALTRWVVMVTINLECHGRIIKTTQHQRTALMNGKVPEGWQVNFGNLEHTTRSSYFQSLGVPIGIGQGDVPLHLNNAHFCIEKAVFHSRSSFGHNTLEVAILAIGLRDFELPVTPLWPSGGRSVESLFRGIGLTPSDLLALEHVPGAHP
jgi:hypothetical protein